MKSTCKWFVYLRNGNKFLSLVISLLLNREPVLAWEQTQSCYSCMGSVPHFLSPSGPPQFSDYTPTCTGHDQKLFLQIKIVLLRLRLTTEKVYSVQIIFSRSDAPNPSKHYLKDSFFNQIEARQHKYLVWNQINVTDGSLLPLPTARRRKPRSQKQLDLLFS